MPRINRFEICAPDEVQVFHLMNRCVRSSFLCGEDPVTGRDYSHRKEWIRARLEELAGIFALDVMGYAVMSNHLHVVVRTRPDLVRDWTDEQVAKQWWNLFPKRRNPSGSPAVPTAQELNALCIDKSGLRERRRRLTDISWFMRCLAEPIARRANREDDVVGRFWDGRFRAVPLLDETAVAACMVYVDLNPVRAGLARSAADCTFTSARDRIGDYQVALRLTDPHAFVLRCEYGQLSGWMSPIPLHAAIRRKSATRRASNHGCLPMTLDQYIGLLEWTANQSTQRSGGICSPKISVLMQRLQVDADTWLRMVRRFSRYFRDAAGRVASRRAFREVRRVRRAAASAS